MFITVPAIVYCVNQEAISDTREITFALYRINCLPLKDLLLGRLNIRP